MPARTYNASEILVMIGNTPITEFADGDAVTFEIDGDDWVTEKGTHGAVIRARSNNALATLTITTMYGSPTNTLLSQLRDADLLTGAGCGSVMIKDLNGTTLASGTASWVKKAPPVKLSSQAGSVEWVFEVADPKLHHGENRLI